MKVLAALLLMSISFTRSAHAADLTTSCADPTRGVFQLQTDSGGKITSGFLELIYKDYRKCDLAKDNAHFATEFGETILKSDCVGSAKLLYDHVTKTVYAIEPEQNRTIGESRCVSFAQDVHPERLIFALNAYVRESLEGTTYAEIEKKASAKLLADAQAHCLAAGLPGHNRPMAAVDTDSGPADHFERFGYGTANSIFTCD